MGNNQTRVQKEKDEVFKSILRERLAFKSKQKIKYIEPIIEPSNINKLMEKMENQENDNCNDLRSMNYARIPPINFKEFNLWKYFHDSYCFERNLDIWKQFHITIKSELILFVIDGRDPQFFFEEDIYKFINEEKVIIIINKSDLMDDESREECKKLFKNIIFYSAKFSKIKSNIFDYSNDQLTDFLINSKYKTIGIIGYPNVGKSSIINSILQTKKAKISSTPGKTKFAQTLILKDKKLIDCPGLIFPKHSKNELLLRGILNIDQTNFKDSFDFIIKRVGVIQILEAFKCKNFINDSRNELLDNFFICFKKSKGWDRGQIIKRVIKEYFEGNLKISSNIKEIEKNYDWALKDNKYIINK